MKNNNNSATAHTAGKRSLIFSGVLLIISAILWGVCSSWPPAAVLTLRECAVFSHAWALLFSFSRAPIAEWALLLLPAAVGLMAVVPWITDGKAGLLRGLSRLLVLCSVLVFLFTVNLGVRYKAPSLSEQLGLQVGQYTPAQLARVTGLLLTEVNRLAPQPARDEHGVLMNADFDKQAQQILTAYDSLSKQLPFFCQTIQAPKHTRVIGKIMSYFGIAGIYVPFTAEAVVSSDSVASHIPFHTAHEAAHAMGVALEDEANFAAALCCFSSNNTLICYSGYLNAYIYCSNALCRVDLDEATLLSNQLCPEAVTDIRTLNAHLAKYETPVKQVGDAVNDAYIKATGVPDGVQSYGRMVDLLIAWYDRLGVLS